MPDPIDGASAASRTAAPAMRGHGPPAPCGCGDTSHRDGSADALTRTHPNRAPSTLTFKRPNSGIDRPRSATRIVGTPGVEPIEDPTLCEPARCAGIAASQWAFDFAGARKRAASGSGISETTRRSCDPVSARALHRTPGPVVPATLPRSSVERRRESRTRCRP